MFFQNEGINQKEKEDIHTENKKSNTGERQKLKEDGEGRSHNGSATAIEDNQFRLDHYSLKDKFQGLAFPYLSLNYSLSDPKKLLVKHAPVIIFFKQMKPRKSKQIKEK